MDLRDAGLRLFMSEKVGRHPSDIWVECCRSSRLYWRGGLSLSYLRRATRAVSEMLDAALESGRNEVE